MNHRGMPNFRGFSAGSHPTGVVNPYAIQQLESAGLSTDGLRSKSWDEFARPGSPKMDFVITVCDNAAAEVCPVWPGGPMAAHWGIPDPVAAGGSPEQIAHAFLEAYVTLDRRIGLLLSLPLASLDSLAMRTEMSRIGDQ